MKKFFYSALKWLIHSPVIDYTTTLIRFQPGFKYLPRVCVYYFKFAFCEPFRLLESIFYGKKIKKFQFQEQPIFILGYYRSGTTHLQESLMQDPKIGYMNFYQTYFNAGFLVSEPILKWIFEKIIRLTRFHHPAHRIPFHFEMPGEEDVCMVSTGFRYAASWGQVYPKYFKYFFNRFVFFKTCTPKERAAFEEELYSLYVRVALAKQNRGKRMVFKSPPQVARPAMLYRFFPNAKFIFIHRSPYEIYKSNQRLWKSFKDQCLHDDPTGDPNEKILWSLSEGYEYYEREKKVIPREQLIEVSYQELLAEPMSTLQKIYERLSIPGFEEAAPHFQKFLNEKHGNNRDSHHYSEADIKMVEKWCEKWIASRGYARPVG